MSAASTEQERLLDAGPAAGDEFEGEVAVVFQRWCSDDGQFAVVVVELESGEEMVAVGPIGHLEEETRARLVGSDPDGGATKSTASPHSCAPTFARARRRSSFTMHAPAGCGARIACPEPWRPRKKALS